MIRIVSDWVYPITELTSVQMNQRAFAAQMSVVSSSEAAFHLLEHSRAVEVWKRQQNWQRNGQLQNDEFFGHLDFR